MTRMEKYRDYHSDVRQMVEDMIIQKAISKVYTLQDKNIIRVDVINKTLISVYAIDKRRPMVCNYLIVHDNGDVLRIGIAYMSIGDYGWQDYGRIS